MDDLARAFYKMKFELAFVTKKAGEFQDFFSSIMEKRYPADFVRMRPWGNVGDRKNDGYVRTRRILFQSYAPNEMEAAKCVAKINEDFSGALPHWKTHFGTWVFVHNSKQGLGPAVLTVLLDLGTANAPLIVTPWGFEELRREAMALSESDLASLLGPAPTRPRMIALALPSHGGPLFVSGAHQFAVRSGRVPLAERMDGIQRASSKLRTALRCSAFSSGASMNVGRRPRSPVVVRTSVAVIPESDAIMVLTDASVPSAILAKLTSIRPITVANV